MLYFLERDGYIKTGDGDTYQLLFLQTSEASAMGDAGQETSQIVPSQIVFEFKPPSKNVREIAQERKAARIFHKSHIAMWEQAMRKKEITRRFVGSEQVLFEFFKQVQSKDSSVVRFEDNHLLVLNKPSGVLLYGGKLGELGVEEVSRYLVSSETTLATRIDPEASGLVVLAKTDVGLEGLISQQLNKKDSGMAESYLALGDGTFYRGKKQFPLSLPISTEGQTRRVLLPGEDFPPGTREAVAFFKSLGVYNRPNDTRDKKTLMQIILLKGTTEDIRAMTQFLSVPVTGDYLYNPQRGDASNMMLHLGDLLFTHPATGKKMDISARPPAAFTDYIRRLTKID